MIQIEVKFGGTELGKVLHYYGLLEQSNEYKIICPFHDDINPSMMIDLNTGTFFCFGCHASGNAFDFVRLVNKKLDMMQCWKEYFRVLSSKKVKNIVIKKRKSIKTKGKQALVEAEDFYFNLKTTNWKKESNDEKKYMKKRGFSSESLNIAKAKLTYNNSYPIVFPMFDLGIFKGWVCRTTSKAIEAKRKYLYNEGFSRRNTLVGDYDATTIMLVEGYMDWLKTRQNGLKNVAAILGWKITDEQIYKLKEQGVKNIISALDNDKCGVQGTEYLKQHFNVFRFQFPKGIKDPGEMDKESFDKARKLTIKLLKEAKTNAKSRKSRKFSR